MASGSSPWRINKAKSSLSQKSGETDSPGGPSGSEPICQCRRHKRCWFDPWVGKICWRRACNPLQYSCLDNPMDKGAWQAMVHRVGQNSSDLACIHTGSQTIYTPVVCWETRILPSWVWRSLHSIQCGLILCKGQGSVRVCRSVQPILESSKISWRDDYLK